MEHPLAFAKAREVARSTLAAKAEKEGRRARLSGVVRQTGLGPAGRKLAAAENTADSASFGYLRAVARLEAAKAEMELREKELKAAMKDLLRREAEAADAEG